MDSESTYGFGAAFGIDSVSSTSFSLHCGNTQGSVLDFESSNTGLVYVFDNTFDSCAATSLSLDVVYPPEDAWDPREYYNRDIVGHHLRFPPMGRLPVTNGEIAKTEVALLGATNDQAHPSRTESTPDCRCAATVEDIDADPTDPIKRTRTSRKRKKRVTQEEEEAKRAKFLERNRLAASKCRRKKEDLVAKLKTRDRKFVRAMAEKLSEAKELTGEVS